MGQEAGFGTELMELPLLAALSVWTPKAHQGQVLGVPCMFSLLLLLTGFCFHSPSEHTACAHGGHTNFAPCGFCTSLHISVCGDSAWYTMKGLFMELVKLMAAGQRSPEHL